MWPTHQIHLQVFDFHSNALVINLSVKVPIQDLVWLEDMQFFFRDTPFWKDIIKN